MYIVTHKLSESTSLMSSGYPSSYDSGRKSRLLPIVTGIVVLGAVAYGVSKLFSGGAPEQHAMPAAAVTVVEVQPKDEAITYEYAGRTAGSREVEIRARVSGILQERTYEEGSEVKEGQVLFKIDAAPFEASRAQQQALLTQTERNWQRVSELYKEKAVSAKEYDDARAAYEQAKATVDTARINLNYTTVRAPFSGVTSKEGLSEGSLVTADTSLLTRLTKLDPLYIEFAYPDSDAISQRRDIASGALTLPANKKLRAEVQFGDGTVFPKEGIVNFTDSIIDASTGTVRARAVLDNKDGALLPGLFVRVVIKGFTRPDAIAIPDQAIMQGPQGQYVYVVTSEGNAAIKPIKAGALLNGGKKLRLIEDGLAAGDKVITEGMIKVRPDAPVSITPPAAADAATAESASEGTPATADAPADASASAKE